MKSIEEYNEIDCESTYILHDFLLKSKYKNPNIRINISSRKSVVEEQEKKKDQLIEISNEMLEIINIYNESDLDKKDLEEITNIGIKIRSQVVLSHLLKFHKKESNTIWWSYFDRKNVNESIELKSDLESIYNANFIKSVNALNKNQKKTNTKL